MQSAFWCYYYYYYYYAAFNAPCVGHNSFRVLFDKIASVYFFKKMYLYFSIGNAQPREPALHANCIGTLSFLYVMYFRFRG